jgi:hypothetical protein
VSGELKFDAVGLEDFLKFAHDILVFGGQDAFAAMDDGHLTAKPAKHLAKFETDVTAAQDEQVFRNFLQIHNGDVGEVRHGIEAGNGWNVRIRSGIDEDLFALEDFVSDLHLMRGKETSAAVNEPNVWPALDSFLNGIAKTLDNTILSGDDGREVDGYFIGMNAPTRGFAGIMSDLG